MKLLTDRRGYVVPTRAERRSIVMAFATDNRVVYGRAFDCVKTPDAKIDLSSIDELSSHLDELTLIEVKSTGRKLPDDFHGYFFSMSTAELLSAQSLGDRFRFVFVNTKTGMISPELPLREIFATARSIYPTWSIQL